MAKKRGGLLGLAVLAGGAAYIIHKLEKKAKEEGKDIGDVAKDSVNSAIEDVKSGKVLEDSKEFVNKTVEDIKSGKIVEDAKETIENAYEDVKSGKTLKEAQEFAKNVKDGVIDIINGKEDDDIPQDEPIEFECEDEDDPINSKEEKRDEY